MGKIKWTQEAIQAESNKYKSRKEFQIKSNRAYKVALRREILDIVCSHMPKHVDQSGENNPNFRWTLENIQEEANKYTRRSDFQNFSDNAYQAALRRNILDDVCKHMQERITEAYSIKELHEEALKYKTKEELCKANPRIMSVVYKRKIVDKICSHMPRDAKIGSTPYNFRWTDEELEKEALKYHTPKEFWENNFSAYVTACRSKIVDKICKHMTKTGGTSLSEQKLLEIIREIYPTACTLRIRTKRGNGLIEGKPHIRGFHIDIYIPELKLGIEFDGIFWHSESGLKYSRPNWPIEDIRNYHEIKDSYFASKGIRILHIEEEDWLANKEACVSRCFEFLLNSSTI